TAVYRVRVGATRVHPSKRKAGAFRKPELHSNHPNPFNPTTTIGYTMAEGGYASLKIMDVYGREVSTLVQGYLQPGTHTSEFNAANLAAGVYVYGLKAGGGFSARKMVLLK
ncbi:MAG TPA: T9SS type A sorting domain-containing protein, partial [bacterium]